MKFKQNPFHGQSKVEVVLRDGWRKYTIRENRDRYFFPDEWMAFYDCLKTKQKLTFQFLVCTGARISECRGVKVGDVDLERQNIVFRWTKSRNKDGTRKIRTIPISSEFKKYLIAAIKSRNLSSEDNFPLLSIPAANIAMKKALRKAEIPDWKMFSVHNVRKTMEMYLLALGIDGMKIVQHMGHSMAIALKHYTSPEIFNYEDRQKMRQIIGDLYIGSMR